MGCRNRLGLAGRREFAAGDLGSRFDHFRPQVQERAQGLKPDLNPRRPPAQPILICFFRGTAMLRDYAKRLFRWLRGRKPPPEDPYASVRHPNRRGPPLRAAGIALEEPPPMSSLNLFG